MVCVLIKKKKILISLRPKGKDFSGYYEFPGGKMNQNEFIIEALSREINEELGVDIDLHNLNFLKSYEIFQKKKKIRLHFFLCRSWKGRIFSKEGQLIKWIYPNELKNYNTLKSNRKFIKFLLYFIFPTTY